MGFMHFLFPALLPLTYGGNEKILTMESHLPETDIQHSSKRSFRIEAYSIWTIGY